jgi:hypothetical protein
MAGAKQPLIKKASSVNRLMSLMKWRGGCLVFMVFFRIKKAGGQHKEVTQPTFIN